MKFDPFANESDALQLGGLNIENRTDRVSFYGSIDITRDKKGLDQARKLAGLLVDVVKKLEAEKLPDEVALPRGTDMVKNPFG